MNFMYYSRIQFSKERIYELLHLKLESKYLIYLDRSDLYGCAKANHSPVICLRGK